MRSLVTLLTVALALPFLLAGYQVRRRPIAATGCTLPANSSEITLAISFEDNWNSGTSTPQTPNPYVIDDEADEYTPDSNLNMTRVSAQFVNPSTDLQGFFSLECDASEYYSYSCIGSENCVTQAEFRVGFLLRYVTGFGAFDPNVLGWNDNGSGTEKAFQVSLDDGTIDGGTDAKSVRVVYQVASGDSETLETDTEPLNTVGNTYFIEIEVDGNNGVASDEIKIYVNGTLEEQTLVADVATLSTLDDYFLFGNTSGQTGQFLLDAVWYTSNKSRDLWTDVCGATTACTGGQEGYWCNPP